jgi:DNA polymerase
MAYNMASIEAHGYAICATVHDEIITETFDDFAYSPEHLSQLLATSPEWARDMPLAAAGFEAKRYKKE